MATVAWPLKCTEDTGLKRLPADLASGGEGEYNCLSSVLRRPFISQRLLQKQHILNKPPAPPSNPPSMEEKCLFHLWV